MNRKYVHALVDIVDVANSLFVYESNEVKRKRTKHVYMVYSILYCI